MTQGEFQNIYNEVRDLLSDNLPDYLTYHSVSHTLEVYDKAIFIGKKENISQSEMNLLKIAALYHDVGFTKTHVEHEQEGCKIAKVNLKRHGLSSEQIDEICAMIMATKIPQNPQNKLEKILADADLEYLGTVNFAEGSKKLYLELLHFNPNLSIEEWNKIQIKFLTNHKYHTNFCKRYKQHRKLKNLLTLK